MHRITSCIYGFLWSKDREKRRECQCNKCKIMKRHRSHRMITIEVEKKLADLLQQRSHLFAIPILRFSKVPGIDDLAWFSLSSRLDDSGCSIRAAGPILHQHCYTKQLTSSSPVTISSNPKVTSSPQQRCRMFAVPDLCIGMVICLVVSEIVIN